MSDAPQLAVSVTSSLLGAVATGVFSRATSSHIRRPSGLLFILKVFVTAECIITLTLNCSVPKVKPSKQYGTVMSVLDSDKLDKTRCHYVLC